MRRCAAGSTSFPDEVVRVRPVLGVGLAGALLIGGDLEGVENRLLEAERLMESPTAEMVVVDDEEFRRLPGMIAVYRAAQAVARGDLPGTIGHARRALDLAPEDDHLRRAAAAGILGLAYWTSGDLDAAHGAWTDCAARLHRAGHLADTFGCAIAMADIRLAQGRLGEAMRTYEQALLRAGGQVLRGAADMHSGMAEIHRERGDLAAATRHVRQSEELGEHAGLPQNRYRRRVVAARIRQAEGDLDGALDLLDEAERRYVGDYFPEVRPVSALRARVWIAQGRSGDALAWARGRGLAAGDDLSYLREFEHITLGSALVAGSPADATRLLERLLRAADEGGRAGSAIQILVLLALAHQARGAVPAARGPLRRAMALAEPEGYARVFLDEGPAMAGLLRAESGSYVRRLLAATGARPPVRAGPDRPAQRARAGRAPAARHRPGRPGHRAPPRRLPEHRADPHPAHLHQARRDEPPGGGPPGRGARPVVGGSPPQSPDVMTPSHHIRSYLSPGERELRDPRQGAPRSPMVGVVRRVAPPPRGRRHHRHPRPGGRPVRTARRAAEGARHRPAPDLDHQLVQRHEETDMTTTLTRTTPDTMRATAFVAGALYILTFFTSIPTLALYAPVLHDPGYIVGPGPDTAVQFGGILEMLCALAGIGTAVALYPVVKRQHEGLALGFVTSRVIEGALIAVGVVSLLSVVALRQDPAGADTASLVTAGKSLVALHNGTFLLGQSLMPGVNALLLGTLLYRSRLVPRWIPTMGLIGAPLLIASVTAAVFGLHEQVSATGAIATLPVALWEASIGVYLVVKGFRAVPGLTSPVEPAH